MKIWAKVTFKDGNQIQRLTLKVEGKGEEAELELALGSESQEVFAEEPIQQTLPEAKPDATIKVPVEEEVKAQPVSETSVQPEATLKPVQETSGQVEEEAQLVPETPEEPEEEIQPTSAAEEEQQPEEVAVQLEAEPEEDSAENELGPEVIPAEEEVEAEEPATPIAEPVAQVLEDMPVVSTIIVADEEVEQPASTPEGTADDVDHDADEEEIQSIPELAKIAQESTSFDNFVDKVILWVNIEKNHRDYFKAVINAATQTGKVNWKLIEVILKRDGIKVNPYSKIRISKSVVAKFQNSKKRVTILKFIKDVVSYKNSFSEENQASHVKTAQETTQVAQTNLQQIAAARAKMPCMPENKEFEEVLGSIDKTQPIDERVKIVLVAMGLWKLSDADSQLLLGIANVAVNLKDIDFDAIFNNLDIPEGLRSSARMRFSSFLNNFIEQHAPDAQMVKTLDFLKDLQNIVMSKQEISALV